ncbi:MAG TPA: hypothetical protein VGV59_16055 [Pyrinomonadaceae bacterium]|nr:hypothetical protein [Pyrinomonadaceae bacterium]
MTNRRGDSPREGRATRLNRSRAFARAAPDALRYHPQGRRTTEMSYSADMTRRLLTEAE